MTGSNELTTLIRDAELVGLQAALGDLVSLHPHMSVSTLHAFITLATSLQDDGSTGSLAALAERHGLAYPTLMRQVDVLGGGLAGKPGLDLIVKEPVPGSRKMKQVRLTEAGTTLVASIAGFLRQGGRSGKPSSS